MSERIGILAQAVAPATANIAAIYTVGEGEFVVVSTITVCNTSGAGRTVRLAIVPKGQTAVSAKNYIEYDTALAAATTLGLTEGYTLAAGDSIWVSASAANDVAVTVFGSRVTT